MRGLIGLGGALLIAAPSPALAHDNLGGDELAVANWMLIAAVVVIVMGVLAGIWAAKSGQFTNIEDFAGITQEGNGPLPVFLLALYIVVALATIGYLIVTLATNYNY